MDCGISDIVREMKNNINTRSLRATNSNYISKKYNITNKNHSVRQSVPWLSNTAISTGIQIPITFVCVLRIRIISSIRGISTKSIPAWWAINNFCASNTQSVIIVIIIMIILTALVCENSVRVFLNIPTFVSMGSKWL